MRFDRVDADRLGPRLGGIEAYERSQPRMRPEGRSEPLRQDRLSLSDRARELGSALKAVQAASDVRLDRVAALQREIAAGTYHVPAATLVDDILRGG